MRTVGLCVLTALLVVLTGCVAAPAVSAAVTSTIAAERTPEPAATPVPINVTLYGPNATSTGLVALTAQAEDSPLGLLSALVAIGALPDVDYGTNITFGVADETVPTEDGEFSGTIVRLDLSDAFAQAVRQSGAQKETLILQSLANTFLARYNADAMVLTIEGTVLETAYEKYEEPITVDEFASTKPN